MERSQTKKNTDCILPFIETLKNVTENRSVVTWESKNGERMEGGLTRDRRKLLGVMVIVVSRIMPPPTKDVPVLILRTCDYVTVRGQQELWMSMEFWLLFI